MIILVGSENAGTGKSTLVTNLAVLFSEQGKSVVIVDTDKQDKKLTSATCWMEKRNSNKLKTEDEQGEQDQSELKSLDCITEYDDLSNKLNELNNPKEYDVVIVDCFTGIHSKFKSALSIADLVVIPFRGNGSHKSDFCTLSSVVREIKKARQKNDSLVNCAVITMRPKPLPGFDNQSIDGDFKTIKLLRPFLTQNDQYQQALNSGCSVVELDDQELKEEIRALFSEINPEGKNLHVEHDIDAVLPSEMDDGSSQEQEFEQKPDFREVFSEDDFSHKNFFDKLEPFSQEQLAEQYKDVFLKHENTELKSKVIKGLILLRAKKILKSNKKLGEWVNSIHSLCVDTQQNRTRYIHLAEFFQSRPISAVISVTVAYEIARPANKDVANKVYEQALNKKLSFTEVQSLIQQEKSNLNLKPKNALPKDSKTIVDEQIKKVLKQVNGFNLGIEEQVMLLRKCISELKIKENDVIDSEPSDE